MKYAPMPCAECGKVFRPKRAGNIYCCYACRKEVNRKRGFPRRRMLAEGMEVNVIRHVECEECGKPFDTKYPDKRFCSRLCRDRQSSRRQYHLDKRSDVEHFNDIKARRTQRYDAWRLRMAVEGRCTRCGGTKQGDLKLCYDCRVYLKYNMKSGGAPAGKNIGERQT